jgi:delta(3,5)-delta(2,4)-dienoyl-CoA isomerase
MNALNLEFFTAIRDAFRAVKDDGSVRCVVLRSEFPKVFTAGLDLKNPPSLPGSGVYSHDGEEYADPARDALKFMRELQILQDAVTAMQECDKPVIACISGLCIGAGVDIITACDIRLCTENALFSVREVDIGLAADVGTLQRLPKIVGNQSWVREVCLTGRDFGSKEALEQGLVSCVYQNYLVMLGNCF